MGDLTLIKRDIVTFVYTLSTKRKTTITAWINGLRYSKLKGDWLLVNSSPYEVGVLLSGVRVWWLVVERVTRLHHSDYFILEKVPCRWYRGDPFSLEAVDKRASRIKELTTMAPSRYTNVRINEFDSKVADYKSHQQAAAAATTTRVTSVQRQQTTCRSALFDIALLHWPIDFLLRCLISTLTHHAKLIGQRQNRNAVTV